MKIASACVLLTSAFVSSAFASKAAPGVPSFLTYRSDGIVLVYVNTARSGTVPACAVPTGSYFRFAIDARTDAGKAQVAGLIAAHAAGEAVWLNGTSDCGVFADTESLADFHTAT